MPLKSTRIIDNGSSHLKHSLLGK